MPPGDGERRGSSNPHPGNPHAGQVFGLLVTKGSRNCSRGCPQAREAELCHCLQEFQPGGSQGVIQDSLVSLTYKTSQMLQNKAAHAQWQKWLELVLRARL